VLEENYSTICHYKKVFNIYLEARLFGRRLKYCSHNIDLFRDILEFKEDGFSNEEVEEMLKQKKGIKEQINYETNNEVHNETTTQTLNEINKDVNNEMNNEINKETNTQTNNEISNETNKQTENEINKDVNNEINKETINEIYNKVYKEIRADLGKDIQIHFASLTLSLEASLNEHLKKLTENINTSMAALQENQQTLYQAITSVNKRVVSMEAELGLEPGKALQIHSFEPGNVQINVEGLAMPLVAAREDPAKEEPVQDLGLEPVLQSITNGIPDREALVHWLKSMRSQNPCPSYADLATLLDNAGVPTSSGRGGWNRSSLSKIISKRNDEDTI